MTREVKVGRVVDASADAVWSVLADFGDIASWNGGVKASHSTSDESGGVGASRHCDLAPVGQLEETIVEWAPAERMVVRIDSAKRLPIREALVHFDLRPVDGTTDRTDDRTEVTITYRYDTKFGVLGAATGPVLDRQLSSGFEGFLDDLGDAAKLAAV